QDDRLERGGQSVSVAGDGGEVLGEAAGEQRRRRTPSPVAQSLSPHHFDTHRRPACRLNRITDHTTAMVRIPASQTRARAGAEPAGVPISSARTVSMTGVIGWCSANPRSQVGNVSAPTNAVDR